MPRLILILTKQVPDNLFTIIFFIKTWKLLYEMQVSLSKGLKKKMLQYLPFF